MQQGLLQQQPCSKQKTSVFSFLLIGLLISFFVSSDVMGSSGGGGTNATAAATTGATILCVPPVCTISGGPTICPGTGTMLCAPVGLASYLWSTGATTQCITVTTPGTYLVTVGSSGGCTSTCNITLGTVTCSITGNTSICPGGTTQLCAIAGATSYAWSNGATTRCISVSTGGTYSVTVCVNGCYLTCSVTVTVNTLNCSISGNNTICSGGSTQLCAPSGAASYSWSTGATTRCITVNSAGTYTVTISNGSCSSTCSKTITSTPPLNCTISGNTSICPGGSTTLCLPSGYASYSWNTGATTRCITVSAAGTYYGNVNDGTCNSTCNATVTVSSPNCSITGSSSICPGSSTQLCAPAGMSSYSWSTGATTQCITVNSAGTYSVTVSNGACTTSCSKTVTVSNPSCTITGGGTICNGNSTQLCAPAGMTSYSWSTGATTQCITVSSSGTYSVTTSNGSCTSSCSKTVSINPPLNCAITGNTTICSGGSTQLCLPSGYASYSWNTGATTRCITVSAAGTYYGNVNDGTCNTTCHVTVTVSNISCSITGSSTICPGGSTQLCAPSGMASYLWSTGATSQCINVNSPGTYTVTVTNGGCTNTCSKTITQSNPNCSITGNTNICQGGSTQLCAPQGMTSYLWSTGATTQCITVNAPGTYSVTVSNGNCSSTCSQTVTQTNPQPCLITGICNICQGGSTQLCAPAGMAGYSWSTGATTQCITVNSAGTYSVSVYDGSCYTNCSVTVTVGNISCSINGATTICPGGSTQLCAPAGMASYSWSTGATTQCITVFSQGTYSVTISNGGCTSSCSATVTQSNPNCAITGNTVICPGGSTQLCATQGMSSYQWSTGATTQCITVTSPGNYSVIVSNGSCSSSCSQNVTMTSPVPCQITGTMFCCIGGTTQLCAPAGMASYSWSTGATTQCITVGPGTYTVTVWNGGCSSSCSATVTPSNPQPCSITGNTNLCIGQTTTLCAPAGMASYLWNTGATTQCINVSSQGTYTVTVNNGGCSSTCSATVMFNNTLVCTITGGTTVCQGGTTQLCAPPGLSYVWSTGATSQCITVGQGTYSVTVTNGSCTSTCTQTVTPGTPLPCSITGNLSFCAGGSTQLCAPAGMASYAWSTGATTQCITVTSAGTYSVTISNGGCSSTCNATVTSTNLVCSITGGTTVPCGGGTTQICAPAGMTSYLWSTGATTQCISVGAGSYTVTISNGSCTSSCSTVINSSNPPPCNVTGNSFICPGGSSQLCAGAGMASYLWSTGATTMCITVSSAATYSVIVTDGNGCVSNCNKVVIVNTPPSCLITGNTNICSGGTTQLCAPAGLVGYLWSTGATTQCISVNSAATYTVIVTDVHGCTSSCSSTVTVTTPQCSITGGNSLCNGPLSLCATQGASSYFWSTGATTQCINVTAPGTYSVTTTYNGGCTSTCSKLVTGGPTCNISGCSTLSANSPAILCAQTSPATYLWSNGATTQCISVSSPGTYSVMVTDANGCVSTCSQTQTIQKCYASPTKTAVTATQTWTFNTTLQTATIRTTFAKTFVDNTYGTNQIGWPNSHTFSNLVGSDHLQLALYDANNVKKMEFKLDYITASNTVASGYKCLGVTGGEGQMITGSASDVVSAKTSLDANFNDYGYVLTSNSPATNANYAVNPTYPNWIYDVWYEVTVKLSAFPAGFGEPVITNVHASPSKTGSNTEIVVDSVCTPCVNPLNLGDLVWFDTNKNGLKDANESGLPNYSVKLYNDNDNNNVPDGPAFATTTTNASGIYGFNGLVPGNYIVGVMLHSGDSMVAINGGDPDNNLNNDNNGLDTITLQMFSKAVTLAFGTEPTNDGDGSDGNLSVDFAIYKSIPTNQICYVGVSHTYVHATQSWTINTVTNEATIRTTFSKNFVDNTYGTNAIGWPSGHTFSNLTGSDKLQLALYDANNVLKLEFKIDYISASGNFSSGYGSLGVLGGDGGMITGNASSIHSTQTSLGKNFNDFGYILTSNSPATNAQYAVNPAYPNWIYDVWYEVTVDLSLFPGGIIRPSVTGIHASPSKTGSNTEIVTDTICIYPRISTPIAVNGSQYESADMYVNAYPNPFKGSTTLEFQRSDKSSKIKIEVYTLSGNKVAEIFNQEAEAGVTYKAEFNAEGLADGIYIYKVETEDRVINGKLILMQ